ncbi:hypothetical protein BCR34DRAFT_196915 [Clohesyomyces aquaticus]|uniref:Kelch repeat protein n=1 Tax=Clohesyomyces aquaticus TaxID=1231657 RepID=A0A1Y1ZXS6_9PLEO|nr:hypothetical protein BCR34DRAFT_196915 [Clohesyomyces aquaticus]
MPPSIRPKVRSTPRMVIQAMFLTLFSIDLFRSANAQSILPIQNAPKLLAERSDDIAAPFVRRQYHGSFVVNKTLYIDGGEYSWVNGTGVSSSILNQTLAIDLSQYFHTRATEWAVKPAVVEKGLCPSLNQVQFWQDEQHGAVYAYGGEISELAQSNGALAVPPESLWRFILLNSGPGGNWEEVDMGDSVEKDLARPSGGSATFGGGAGYYFGGYTNKRTSRWSNAYDEIPSLAMQEMNFTTAKFNNNTASGYSKTGTHEFGGMIHVPSWGERGLVVVIGGRTSPSSASFDGSFYQDMAQIHIYDPTLRRWFSQTASGSPGSIPTQRDRFCVVGNAAGNGSTFEIFIYGGHADLTSQSPVYDEVFVLSLPRFRWYKANYTATDARIRHTCHAIGRQMISVGGVNSTDIEASNDPDQFTQGIKVFDMTLLRWNNSWNAGTPKYETSSIILHDSSSNENQYPEVWDDQELRDIFLGVSKLVPDSKSGTPMKASHSNAGLIAGAVVGAVAAIVIIGAVLLYAVSCRRGRTTVSRIDPVELPHQHRAELAPDHRAELSAEPPPVEFPPGGKESLDIAVEHTYTREIRALGPAPHIYNFR